MRACLLFCASLLFACSDESSLTTAVKTDPSVDFTQYHTYALADGTSVNATIAMMIPDDVKATMNQINQLAGNELMKHGLTQVARDANPDLVVASFVYSNEETYLNYVCVPGSWWYTYWYYYWDPCAYLVPYLTQYTVGSVVVGVGDPAMMKFVFGGLIQGVVDGSTDQAQEVQNAIVDIFEQYPANVTP